LVRKMPGKVTPEVIEELRKIVGDQNILTDKASLSLYSKGAVEWVAAMPDVVVFPENTEQVSKIVRLAYEREIPVIPRGGGSSVTGAVVAIKGGIIIDFRRMNKIIVDIDNGYVIAEPGATILEVNNELKKYGFFFPPDPASERIATVGGALAENSGGMRCAKYGLMKDWVLKLEVVLADGTVTTFGGATYKERAGFNLVGLIIGSEGTLAIITKAWLKIAPIPEATAIIAGFFNDLRSAGKTIFEIRRRGIDPLILEYADKEGIAAANKIKKTSYPEVDGGMVLVGVGGPAKAIDDLAERVVNIMKEFGAYQVYRPKTVAEREEILDIRRIAFTAPGQFYPGFIDMDIVVPLSKIEEALAIVDQVRKKYNVYIAIAGHAGDGNLHPNIGVDPANKDEWERGHKAARELMEAAIKLGGSFTAEHGVGKTREEIFVKQLEERGQLPMLRLMREIKKIFDPKNILNPGKFALEG